MATSRGTTTVLALVVGFGLLPPISIKMEKLQLGMAGGVGRVEQDLAFQLLTFPILHSAQLA